MTSRTVTAHPPIKGYIPDKATGPGIAKPPIKGFVPDKARGPGYRRFISPTFERLAQNYQSGGLDHHELSHLVSAALANIRKAADPCATAQAYIARFGEMFAIEQEARALYAGFPAQAEKTAAQAAKKPKMNRPRI